MRFVTPLQFPEWIISVNQNFGPGDNNQWLSPIPANDSRALQVWHDVICKLNHSSDANVFFYQDPKDPLADRKIGWFSAPPPPADGWAPSFPLDVDVDMTKFPANSTIQVRDCA